MTKKLILGYVCVLFIGIGIGRFSLPAKIITKTETVTVDNTKQNTNQNDHSITTTTQTKNKDGSVTTVTQVAKNVQTITKINTNDTTASKTDKEVIYNTNKWMLGAIASAPVLSGLHPTVTYGGVVTYRILGPITVGGMGLANGTVGAILGISF